MARRRNQRPERHVFELPVDEDVRREVRFHIEMKMEELMAQGLSRTAARREAELCFGDVAAVEDVCREIEARSRRSAERASRLETFWQDVRFGARTLLRRPTFTIVAVVTLGLGVGANTAVFAVIERMLIAPLPFPEADRLVRIWEVNARGLDMALAYDNYIDIRERMGSLESIATHPTFWFGGSETVLGGSRPVRRRVSSVSSEYFRLLGVRPMLGRVPEPAEAAPGSTPVAVVSHAFWSDLLEGVQELSSASIAVGSTRYQVIGVMPPGHDYPSGSDVWIPSDPEAGGDRTSHNYAMIGRLRTGVTVADAQGEATALATGLKQQFGERMSAVDFRVRALRDELYGDYRRPLVLLLGAAAVVLLVACTNLASTLLARASAREQEFAVRSSLGAGRGRIVRQLFTESLLLALLGAIAGVSVAAVALRAIVAFSPSSTLRGADLSVGPTVLGFSFAASFLAAVIFGLLPALRSTRADLATVLREGGRSGSGGRARVWSFLIISEAALALVLLVSSSLLLRAFVRLLGTDPGFDPAGVIVAETAVPATRYPNDTTVSALHERVLAAVRAIPGVEAAGMVSHLPFGGMGINGALVIEGKPDAEPYADYRVATSGYFDALRIPIVSGRAFGDGDRIGTTTVAIVTQSFADRFFPDEDAVGRRIRDLTNDSWYYGREEWVTIVGVAGDVRHRGFLAAAAPAVYVCSCQRAMRMYDPELVVRTALAPTSMVAALRTELNRIEPEMPVDFSLMSEVIRSTVADRRFSLMVLGAFAALTLLLAGVGIYGVVSYAVARRTREMGIRMALGARPAGVAAMLIRRSLLIVAVGIAIGAVSSAAVTRLIASQLAGAPGLDGRTLAVTASILLGVALIASWIPARRVTRIEPLKSLRGE
jgi:predicted permease